MNKAVMRFIKNKKQAIILFIIAFFGLILFIYGSKEPVKNTENIFSDSTYVSELENNLEMLINNVSGASDAKVMITLESGNEYVYASDDTELAQKHVIVDNGLVCVTEKYPKIKGVGIVCKGGENPKIKSKITELVCSVLGIYSSNVYVTE